MALTSDFDYHLPRRLIAQDPLKERQNARLLVLERSSGTLHHRHFTDVPEYLNPRDVLVLNDTRVLRSRFMGRREGTGGKVEVLLIEPASGEAGNRWAGKGFEPSSIWLAYTRSGGQLRPGERIVIPGGCTFTLLERLGEDGDLVAAGLEAGEDIYGFMERAGHTPLPPYIERGRKGTDTRIDREFYQTVYASNPGAVAAPTAGLHFTEALLGKLRNRGVEVAHLTLHVGPGTFRPVKVENPAEHSIHSERYKVPPETVGVLRRARRQGSSIVAVGTTVVRTLETIGAYGLENAPLSGRTDIFIRPPYRFRMVDALITNFHLPRSTLLMLVAAFAGRKRILEAYAEAVRKAYRFFSYGDAMLII